MSTENILLKNLEFLSKFDLSEFFKSPSKEDLLATMDMLATGKFEQLPSRVSESD
jgi:hypothetical protein